MELKSVNCIEESWRTYSYKQPNDRRYLSKKLFKAILQSFFKKLIKQLILTGDKYCLPSTFGCLQIIKYKTRGNVIDFKTTRDVFGKKPKKSVKHSNKATGGYWTRLHWYKRPHQNYKYGAVFKHSQNYELKLTRPNLRPNSYNKNNPEVSLYPFFKEEGYKIYVEKERH